MVKYTIYKQWKIFMSIHYDIANHEVKRKYMYISTYNTEILVSSKTIINDSIISFDFAEKQK